MRFILGKTFSFNKDSENWTLSNIKYADKNWKNSLFFVYLKTLEQLTKLLHMDTFKVH